MAEVMATAAELPPKIGRHDVLGYLATGGMAEIFLGREPSGRPVVIKRILPHLARQGNFVSMFIDEARIGSLVHHPNVVEIHELGQVGTDLFMVMEYLEGENTSGLMRRLFNHHEILPFALGAYIVAEACAGLSAAHDLRDELGKPLGLVHRDISPQNIFLTYGGEVKVLDFGIATAAHRLTRTATGQLKGKFSYMSPEQCRGEALDLRSDIFSLGVVLYELTTQRRLFKRPNELMVLKAVTEHRITRPRREVPGYPTSLEMICMKALEREPAHRYDSALELRNDLLAVIAELGFTQDPRRALAHKMELLFAERIIEKRQMLRDVRMGTGLGVLPTAEVDESVEVPQVEEELSATPAPRPTPMPGTDVVTRGARGLRIALTVLVLLGAAAGALWWFGLRDERAVQIATPSPTHAEPAVPIALPSLGISLHVQTIPPGATLVVDGETKGTTPVDVHFDAKREIKLALTLPGYAAISQEFTIDHDQDLLIPLGAEPVTPTVPATPTVPPPMKSPKHDPKRPKTPEPNPFQRFD